MIPERLAWAGNVVMACVGIYLSFVPIANQLGKWVIVALGALIILGAVFMFPWRRRADGSAARLINVRVSGRGNRTQIATGDNANQVMADRDVTVHRDLRSERRQ
jgi:hypothetical protein